MDGAARSRGFERGPSTAVGLRKSLRLYCERHDVVASGREKIV